MSTLLKNANGTAGFTYSSFLDAMESEVAPTGTVTRDSQGRISELGETQILTRDSQGRITSYQTALGTYTATYGSQGVATVSKA